MKNISKILALLAIVIPVSMVLYISSHNNQYRHISKKAGYSYKDGLIYKRNSTELFTGYIIDTSDVIINFEVVDGKRNGAFITFYFNGKYEKYGFIENNKNEGEWRYFYPDGQLESVGSYRSNKPFGRWTFYYPDGLLKADGIYINGLKHGAWMYYDTNGKWSSIRLFENGIVRDVLRTI